MFFVVSLCLLHIGLLLYWKPFLFRFGNILAILTSLLLLIHSCVVMALLLLSNGNRPTDADDPARDNGASKPANFLVSKFISAQTEHEREQMLRLRAVDLGKGIQGLAFFR